ncbi:MAG: tRNA (adenosine(37)-N6)-threonylcarbamoyltransferase complex transferase subunit TsaD [Phycisphaeraceae bacterium]|nr:tRNA (adenosine(37)-N6)-threonylcarbamoyltransferase complex transferase subunit TsaD [Phycisphaeraceae bacterium]
MPLILGIETSCDETAAAVVEDGRSVRSSIVATQHDLHEAYGGVVPEIASRAHLENLQPAITAALDEAGLTLQQLDAIAVGNRPGLIGSLLIGVSAAQSLAWSLDKPLIAIDHLQAHLYAVNFEFRISNFEFQDFPALGLVISGGHTSLYRMTSFTQLEPLGRTIDDAVGEAYDKAAVILGAGYPGGPALDRLAQQGDASNVEPLPRSMLEADSLDFSYSGLKTALLYRVRGHPIGRGKEATFQRSAEELSDTQRADLAAAFQGAAIGVLFDKLRRALQRYDDIRAILIGGGVCANSHLRKLAASFDLPVHLPPQQYCVDNAAMIAGMAYEFYQRRKFAALNVSAVATTGACGQDGRAI